MASILEKPFLIPDQDAVDGGTVFGSAININHVMQPSKMNFTPPQLTVQPIGPDSKPNGAAETYPGYHIIFTYKEPGRRADKWSFLVEATRNTEYDNILTLLAQEIAGS